MLDANLTEEREEFSDDEKPKFCKKNIIIIACSFVAVFLIIIILSITLSNKSSSPTPKPSEEPVVPPKPTEEPVVPPKPTEEPVIPPKPTEEPVVPPKPTEEPVVPPKPTEEPVVLPKAQLYGDFVQQYFFDQWTDDKFIAHFEDLKSAGMKTLILQMGLEFEKDKITVMNLINDIPKNKFAPTYKKNEALLGKILSAAKTTGCTVWIGLSHSGEWWNGKFNEQAWQKTSSDFNKQVMDSIVKYYYNDYKDQIEGIYWPYEMYPQTTNYEPAWITMMNTDIAYLNKLSIGSLPLMIAPFNSGYNINNFADLTPQVAKEMWARFFQQVSFRKNDIFCPQDCMYSQELTLDKAIKYLVSMYEAVKESDKGIRFWTDVETFEPNFNPADMTRYIGQLKECNKYSEKMVAFSYTHYYSIASNKNQENRKKYLEYIKTL